MLVQRRSNLQRLLRWALPCCLFALLAALPASGIVAAGPDQVPPGVSLSKRGTAPVIGCDSCTPQSVRLVAVVLLANDARRPTIDPRVRLAAWSVTDTSAVAAGASDVSTAISPAASVVLPNLAMSHLPPHSVSLPVCRDLLSAAGFPSTLSPRLVLPLEVPAGDPLLARVASEFGSQLAQCGIAVEPTFHGAAESTAILGARSFTAALVSFNVDADKPFDLLNRLYAAGSPENYGMVGHTPTALDGLLAAAASAGTASAQSQAYSEINNRVMAFADTFGSVLPLLWQYGYQQPDKQPPAVSITSLTKDELTVTLGVSTHPGTGQGPVIRTQVLWGDGVAQETAFPASHTYPKAGTYTIAVVAYQANGVWGVASRVVSVALKPLPLAKGGTLSVKNAAMVDRNQAEVLVHYTLDGANDGDWTANVYYLQWCRDSTGKTTGSSDGHGGLISYNAQPLVGTSGDVTLTFTASIVSNTPEVSFPIDCTHLIITLAHRPGGGAADILINSLPLSAPTRWESGAYVVNCTTCNGW